MSCKEEGCGFVTDAAEDEAHLPLVMKVMVVVVIMRNIMAKMVTVEGMMATLQMTVVIVRLSLGMLPCSASL